VSYPVQFSSFYLDFCWFLFGDVDDDDNNNDNNNNNNNNNKMMFRSEKQ
jgi:hypothetical protein